MNDQAIKNMAEFSQLSGISRPTVSKYFNDPTSVRKSTRAQIEKALQRYDYRPNLFAVNLNKRKPRIIGMIVPDLTDPFYAQVVQHIQLSCNAVGFFLLILSSRGTATMEAQAIETLLSLNISGAIVAPLGHHSKPQLMQNLKARIPVVFLDSHLDASAPYVGTNNRQSVALITEYLCRTGERPSFFEMPAVNHNAEERRAAYIETMERLGLQPDVIAVPANSDWRFEEVGYIKALRIIDGGAGFPTRTILCANDRVAMGVMAAAFERGLKIGRDADCHLRIAGHDDHPLSRYTCPAMTTVAQDFATLGNLSLDLLLKSIEAGHGPSAAAERISLDAKLVTRHSA